MKRMKNTFVGMLLLLFAPVLWAQDGIDFYHGSFAEAQNVASDEGKLIFMDGYATWCGPCKWMAKNSFTDPAVGDLFNKSFINLKVDMEKGEGPRLARLYRIRAYPTIFILNSEGEVLEKMEGALPASSLRQWAMDAIKEHAPNLLEEEPQEQQVEDAGDLGATEPHMELENNLVKAIESGDKVRFEALSADVIRSDHPEKDILFIDAQRAWCIASETPGQFVDRVNPLFESEREIGEMALNAAAWYTFELSKDEDDLIRAAGWAQRAIDLDANYYNLDTYAQILYGLGEAEEAKIYAEKAIEVAKLAGINAEESKGLLTEIDSKQ